MSFTPSLDGSSSIGMPCTNFTSSIGGAVEALAGHCHGPLLGQGCYPQQPSTYVVGEPPPMALPSLTSCSGILDGVDLDSTSSELFPSLDQLLVCGEAQAVQSNGTDVLLSSTDIAGRGAGTSSDSGTENSDSDIACYVQLTLGSTTPEVSPVTEISMDTDYQPGQCQEMTVIDCPMCSHVSTCKQDHIQHQEIAHDLYACATCLQLFSTFSELNTKHAKRCKGPLVCTQPDCRATFASERNYKRHLSRKHLRSESQPCEICGKVISTPANLKVHMLQHESEGGHPISCTLCGAAFRQNLQLQVHLDAYHAEVELAGQARPHACPEPHCDKRYLYAVTLKRHLRAAHQKERHPCDLCPMTFAMEADLQRHRNALHLSKEEGRRFVCSEPGCTAAFVRNYQLEAHKRLHRPVGYENGGSLLCPFCPSNGSPSFVSLGNLREHVSRKHRSEAVGPDDPETRRAVMRHTHNQDDQEPNLDLLSGILSGECDMETDFLDN